VSALERWARVVVYFAGVAVVCAYMEVIATVWSYHLTHFSPAARVRRFNVHSRQWGVALCELTLRVLRAQLTVRGRVPPGRYVVASNHQSTADIAILMWTLRTLNCKFVAKRELGWCLPAVSSALAHGGSALISRTSSRRDVDRLRAMAAGLERWDGSAVLFVEGHRSRDGQLLPYRSAAVRVVAEVADLPLLPVAIDGTHVASDLPAFARRMPGARGCITIGSPIPPERWRGRLEATLEEIRAWAAGVIEQGRLDGTVPPPAGWAPGHELAG
jgi:1-acyl-sn-glycerol-3-phosphate acyltransferase